MKNQIFVILLFLISNVSAIDGFDYNENATNKGDVIFSYDDVSIVSISGSETSSNNFLEESAFVGAVASMGVIHAIFWVPIVLFIAIFTGVLSFYHIQFEKNDRGPWKLVIAIFAGLIAAGLLWSECTNFTDNITGEKGCGKLIAKAYLADGVNKSIRPSSYKFGTKIIETGCF